MSSDTDSRPTPAEGDTGDEVRLHALHVLRIVGLASFATVAGFTGIPRVNVEAALRAAAAFRVSVGTPRVSRRLGSASTTATSERSPRRWPRATTTPGWPCTRTS